MDSRIKTKNFILIKFIVTVFFSGLLGAYIFRNSEVAPATITSFIFFLILALYFEVTSFKLILFGSVNPAFAVYFAILILFGAPLAIVAVLVNSVFRALVIDYPDALFKLADFSDSLVVMIFSALVYHMVNMNSSFLSFPNVAALIVMAVIYYIMDYLLPASFIGICFPDKQKTWNLSKTKTTIINIAVVPVALAGAVLYKQNPYLVLLMIPLLIAMRYMQGMAVYVGKLKNVEAVENRKNFIENELDRLKEQNMEITGDLQKKVDELSIFFELGHVLGANLSLDSVLSNIILMIRRLIFCQSCVIFLYNKEGELIPYKYSTPYKEILEASDLLKLEESVVKEVISDNKPVLVGDMRQGSEQRIFKDECSAMGIPLIIQNELIGVIYIGDKNLDSYTTEHVQSVSNLATASAIAIKSALLFEEQGQTLREKQKIIEERDNKIKEISIISDFGKALGSTLHLKETMKIVTDAAKGMLNYETCAIFLFEGETDAKKIGTRHIVTISKLEEIFKDLKPDIKSPLFDWILTNKKVLLLEEAAKSVLGALIEEEQSIILAPLIVENEIIGVIYFGASKPNSFTSDQLGFVISVSYQAAMAIKNAEFYERIAALAITDGLTGLYTHRYFQERLEESIKWAARYEKPVSLVFIDLDHFKQFNDTLGHPAGDKILAEISGMLKSFTRESDFVARYGGDEFSIVLTDINKTEALVIAERIREGFFIHVNKYPVQITASVGVASYPEDAKTKNDLVLKADIATYKSKHGGKNRVTGA